MLLLATAAVAGEPNTGCDPFDVATIRWAVRAENYAVKVAPSATKHLAWADIVAAYINAGEPAEANEALARIGVSRRISTGVRNIAMWHSSASGDDLEAVQFAQSIEGEDDRDGALVYVALAQVHRGLADRAIKTLRLIRKDHFRNYTWYMIVLPLASTGRYGAAREALEQIDPQEIEWKQDAREIIEMCRSQDQEFGKRAFAERLSFAACAPNPYAPWRASLLKAGDSVLLLIYAGDWRRTEADAEAHGGPSHRALAWLQLAWEYHDRGRPEARDRAIAKAVEHLQSASDFNRKADGYCLLADLCVELGRKEQARQFLAETGRAAKAGEKRQWDNGCDPLWIGVLVLLGEIDAAVEVAQSPQGRAGIGSWQALGEVLAYEDHTDEVEKRLAAAPDDTARALLCVGAAGGLQKRKLSARLHK